MKPDDFKTIIDILASIVTALALIIGGIWSYMLFVVKRQRFPRAKIEHQLVYQEVNEVKGLLSVDIYISNTGDVKLDLISWDITVFQMLPPKLELERFLKEHPGPLEKGLEISQWQLLARAHEINDKGLFEIEPGELHQIHNDFLVNQVAETVQLVSFIRNAHKKGKPIGWESYTIHDLTKKEIEKPCNQDPTSHLVRPHVQTQR